MSIPCPRRELPVRLAVRNDRLPSEPEVGCPRAAGRVPQGEHPRGARCVGGAAAWPRSGFSLIEILVALALVAVLSVTVFPIAMQQIERVPPFLVARDLRNIGTGIRTFHLNLLESPPGDLEDLVSSVDASDRRTNATPYPADASARWRGPYVDLDLPSGGQLTGNAHTTGFDARIQQEVVCFEVGTNSEVACAEGGGVFVAVKTINILGAEFDRVNDIIDGTAESDELRGDGRTDARTQGKLRLVQQDVIFLPAEDGTMYYLVMPFTVR